MLRDDVRAVQLNPHDTYEKPLPNHTVSEQAILGSIMLNNELLAETRAVLEIDDFFLPSHRTILETYEAMAERGEALDPVTVMEEMRRVGTLDRVGGATYIAGLIGGDCTRFPESLQTHLNAVKDSSILRQLAKAGSLITCEALDAEDLPDNQLSKARRLIERIEDRRPLPDLRSALMACDEYDARLSALYDSDRPFLGIGTGCYKLDFQLGGMQRSDLIIVAARPSMGKTAALGRLAAGVAQSRDNDNPVQVVFTLETPPKELAFRLRCGMGKVDSLTVRNKRATVQDFQRLERAKQVMAEWKLFLFGQEDGAGSVREQAALLRRVQREHGHIDAIYLDHLSFCSFDRQTQSRAIELDLITQEQKRMAVRHDAPFVVLSQLSRANSARGEKRPQLSDLRDSGGIEQNADVVIFLHREFYYDKRADPTLAEWNIAKQRNGPLATVEMNFDSRYAWFENRIETHTAGSVSVSRGNGYHWQEGERND